MSLSTNVNLRKFNVWDKIAIWIHKWIIQKKNQTQIVIDSLALLAYLADLGYKITQVTTTGIIQLEIIDYAALGITVALPVFYRIICNMMKHKGGNFMLYDTEYFHFNDRDRAFDISHDATISKEKFQRVQNQNNDLFNLTAINLLCYKWTIFYAPFEKKDTRNKEHIEQNDQSAFFIMDDNNICGYTHILPVDKNTWDEYLEGKIDDNELKGKDICDPETEPYGLILFGFGYYSKKNDPRSKRERGNLLLHALAFHLDHYCQRECKNMKKIPVLLQSMDTNLLSFFRSGFTSRTTPHSKENIPIVRFKIVNRRHSSNLGNQGDEVRNSLI